MYIKEEVQYVYIFYVFFFLFLGGEFTLENVRTFVWLAMLTKAQQKELKEIRTIMALITRRMMLVVSNRFQVSFDLFCKTIAL
jgi:hypothetical protein